MMETTIIAQAETLSIAGWMLMIGCIGLVCGLMVYCYWRVLRGPNQPKNEP